MHYEICLVKLWNDQCGTSEHNTLQKFINQLFFPKFCKESVRSTVKPTIKVQIDCDIKTEIQRERRKTTKCRYLTIFWSPGREWFSDI